MIGDLARGTPVSWAYRGTRGYGHILRLLTRGTKRADDRYAVRQVDNHISATGSREPRQVIHTRGNLRREPAARVRAAAAAAGRSRRRS